MCQHSPEIIDKLKIMVKTSAVVSRMNFDFFFFFKIQIHLFADTKERKIYIKEREIKSFFNDILLNN